MQIFPAITNFRILMTTILCGVMFMALDGHTQTGIAGRPGLVLESGGTRVVYDLGGGALAVLQHDGSMNPFTWNQPSPGDLEPRQMAHFICFDRWGPASEAEQAHGMPPHGESNQVMWDIETNPHRTSEGFAAGMSCELPIAGMRLERSMVLDADSPVMRVTERFTNRNSLGRLINLVQHPTIGPPFLDETTLFDTSVQKGFAQKGDVPTPQEPVMYWPNAVHDGGLVDFRRLSGDNRGPSVTSFVLNDDAVYGWVTVCNPGAGLLVGYVWDAEEYPWLSFWRNVQDGRPFSAGMEFGTTGLHQPYGVQVRVGGIWGRRLYEYIDADETREKSYVVFLADVPEDFAGVASCRITDGFIELTEHGETPRIVTVRSELID